MEESACKIRTGENPSLGPWTIGKSFFIIQTTDILGSFVTIYRHVQQVTEELQKYKPAVAQNKKPLKRARKRSDVASKRVEILGEIDDDGVVIDTELQDADDDDQDEEP